MIRRKWWVMRVSAYDATVSGRYLTRDRTGMGFRTRRGALRALETLTGGSLEHLPEGVRYWYEVDKL